MLLSKRNTKWFWFKTEVKDYSFSTAAYLNALHNFGLKLVLNQN